MTAHFILYVSDQPAARDFFSMVLDRAPRLDVPGMTELALPGGGVLGLMPEAGIRRLLGDALPDPAASRPPRAELYLLVDDVARYHERALGAGAKELSPPAPRDWGHYAAYCLGPDGHVVAFASATMRVAPEVSIGRATRADYAACERILRALPDWFGIETALVAYVERLPELVVDVARREGAVVGFVAVERHAQASAEILVTGVAPEHQRRGIGRALVHRIEHELRADGVEYLQVKTLSAAREHRGHAMTRSFYAALGFVPLEEQQKLWGPAYPALQMIKRL